MLPVSTETEFRDAMERDYGHSVRGLGPKQSADAVAAAVVRCLLHPIAEVYPHRNIARPDDHQRARAGLHRRPGAEYGRRAGTVTEPVAPLVEAIAREAARTAAAH